jgi:hypothetical protein
LFVTIACGSLRQLDASVGASGPHDFAVRKRSALVRSVTHVHRIPPRVRDDRERPSIGTGWRINKTVSTKRRNEIFLQRGLDSKSLGSLIDLPVGQITQAYRSHVHYSPIATKFRRAANDAMCQQRTKIGTHVISELSSFPETYAPPHMCCESDMIHEP